MEKILLVGAGGFGRVVLEHASKAYDCAFVDDGPCIGTVVNGCSVIGRVSDLEKLHSVPPVIINVAPLNDDIVLSPF